MTANGSAMECSGVQRAWISAKSPGRRPIDEEMLRRFFPDRDKDGEPDLPEGFSLPTPEEGGFEQFSTGSGGPPHAQVEFEVDPAALGLRDLLDRLGLPHDALPHLGSWKADTWFLWRIVEAIETLHRDRLGEQIERRAHHGGDDARGERLAEARHEVAFAVVRDPGPEILELLAHRRPVPVRRRRREGRLHQLAEAAVIVDYLATYYNREKPAPPPGPCRCGPGSSATGWPAAKAGSKTSPGAIRGTT